MTDKRSFQQRLSKRHEHRLNTTVNRMHPEFNRKVIESVAIIDENRCFQLEEAHEEAHET